MIRLALLASLATAQHWDMTGVSVERTDSLPSCGAADRLLRDRYSISIDGEQATINGTPWHVDIPGDLVVLSHRADPNAFTRMTMLIDGSQATLDLVSLTADRVACEDRVRLRSR